MQHTSLGVGIYSFYYTVLHLEVFFFFFSRKSPPRHLLHFYGNITTVFKDYSDEESGARKPLSSFITEAARTRIALI